MTEATEAKAKIIIEKVTSQLSDNLAALLSIANRDGCTVVISIMQIHEHDTIHYVRISEVPEENQAALIEWMAGQTRPLIDDLDPQDAIYVWDWDRYNHARKHGRVLWD